jgi:hypothetical protein
MDFNYRYLYLWHQVSNDCRSGGHGATTDGVKALTILEICANIWKQATKINSDVKIVDLLPLY